MVAAKIIVVHEVNVAARRRFKALVRKVINNRYWLDAPEFDVLGYNVARNVHLLLNKSKLDSSKSISLTAKSILYAKPKYRTEEEIAMVREEFASLTGLAKLSRLTRLKIAQAGRFLCLNSGRVVIKEGHRAEGLYFILHGTVAVSITPRKGQAMDESYYSSCMGEGDVFGEMGIVFDKPRAATVTTTSNCELLVLWRRDFNNTLRAVYQKKFAKILAGIELFSYFNKWDEHTKDECCIVGKVHHFQKDETILGDNVGVNDSVYFILNGKCAVIEELWVGTYYHHGIKKYELHDENVFNYESDTSSSTTKSLTYNDSNSVSMISVGPARKSIRMTSAKRLTAADLRRITNPNLEQVSDIILPKINKSLTKLNIPKSYFMQLCIISDLGCFGLGENLKNRRIVAVTDVNCLLLPKNWLLSQSTNNLWARIRQYLDFNIPKTEEVFNQFVTHRKWRLFTNKFMNDYYKDRIPVNSIYNVPYSIRIQQTDQN